MRSTTVLVSPATSFTSSTSATDPPQTTMIMMQQQQQPQQQNFYQRNGAFSGASINTAVLPHSNVLPNTMNSFGPGGLPTGPPMQAPDYLFVFASKMDRNGVILGVDCDQNKVAYSRISWLIGRRLSDCCYRNDDVEIVNKHLNDTVASRCAVSLLYRICSTTPPPSSNDNMADGVKSESMATTSNGMLSTTSKSNSFDANNSSSSGNNSSCFDGDTKERISSGETSPIHFLIRSQSSQHTGLDMSPPDSSMSVTPTPSSAALASLNSSATSTKTSNGNGGKSAGRRPDQSIPKHCETISSTHYVIMESSTPIPASRMQNVNDLLLMSTPGPRTELLCDPAAEPWPLQQLTGYLHPPASLISNSMPPSLSYDPNFPLHQRQAFQRSHSRTSNSSGSAAGAHRPPTKLERMLSQDAAPPPGNPPIKTEAGDLVTANAKKTAGNSNDSSNPLLKRMLVKAEPGAENAGRDDVQPPPSKKSASSAAKAAAAAAAASATSSTSSSTTTSTAAGGGATRNKLLTELLTNTSEDSDEPSALAVAPVRMGELPQSKLPKDLNVKLVPGGAAQAGGLIVSPEPPLSGPSLPTAGPPPVTSAAGSATAAALAGHPLPMPPQQQQQQQYMQMHVHPNSQSMPTMMTIQQPPLNMQHVGRLPPPQQQQQQLTPQQHHQLAMQQQQQLHGVRMMHPNSVMGQQGGQPIAAGTGILYQQQLPGGAIMPPTTSLNPPNRNYIPVTAPYGVGGMVNARFVSNNMQTASATGMGIPTATIHHMPMSAAAAAAAGGGIVVSHASSLHPGGPSLQQQQLQHQQQLQQQQQQQHMMQQHHASELSMQQGNAVWIQSPPPPTFSPAVSAASQQRIPFNHSNSLQPNQQQFVMQPHPSQQHAPSIQHRTASFDSSMIGVTTAGGNFIQQPQYQQAYSGRVQLQQQQQQQPHHQMPSVLRQHSINMPPVPAADTGGNQHVHFHDDTELLDSLRDIIERSDIDIFNNANGNSGSSEGSGGLSSNGLSLSSSDLNSMLCGGQYGLANEKSEKAAIDSIRTLLLKDLPVIPPQSTSTASASSSTSARANGGANFMPSSSSMFDQQQQQQLFDGGGPRSTGSNFNHNNTPTPTAMIYNSGLPHPNSNNSLQSPSPSSSSMLLVSSAAAPSSNSNNNNGPSLQHHQQQQLMMQAGHQVHQVISPTGPTGPPGPLNGNNTMQMINAGGGRMMMQRGGPPVQYANGDYVVQQQHHSQPHFIHPQQQQQQQQQLQQQQQQQQQQQLPPGAYHQQNPAMFQQQQHHIQLSQHPSQYQ